MLSSFFVRAFIITNEKCKSTFKKKKKTLQFSCAFERTKKLCHIFSVANNVILSFFFTLYPNTHYGGPGEEESRHLHFLFIFFSFSDDRKMCIYIYAYPLEKKSIKSILKPWDNEILWRRKKSHQLVCWLEGNPRLRWERISSYIYFTWGSPKIKSN